LRYLSIQDEASVSIAFRDDFIARLPRRPRRNRDILRLASRVAPARAAGAWHAASAATATRITARDLDPGPLASGAARLGVDRRALELIVALSRSSFRPP
jgi:hypothetical protein